ncbi:hypothetical protein AJ79_03222 [Helicocarpus griseus UAMH5409]|uniref:Uncharacterized protein n=1 Tax=Helicocarpus griseus UAMH5409 TaxID=1447875 RepID=A0A2B7XYT4_9EURO|nr:hypothetical protein AJ79_03222 [Helicocarpus griseus UAMH5409]
MVNFQYALIFSSFVIAHASQSKIQWGPCDPKEVGNSTEPIQCGTLPVPLDYSDPKSDKKLQLRLAKISATSQPSRGSILFNFGGPGQLARKDLASTASLLLPLTGGQYDLVTFDTRGTGNTLPFICPNEGGNNGHSIAAQIKLGNSSDVAVGDIWARSQLLAKTCFENQNEEGSLISTAFVARDLISVVDAIEYDKMLRYWGLSYGTTLGATVAAMFPDRIDKLILDGVQNPHEYYQAFADFEEWTDSDKVFSGIFSSCLEAPDNCPLAHRNATAAELEKAVLDFLDTIKYRPIVFGNTILDYTIVKGALSSSLYGPPSWPMLTQMIDMLLPGGTPNSPPPSLGQNDPAELDASLDTVLSLLGIHCLDRVPRNSSFDDMIPVVERLYEISRIMGDATVFTSMACAQWKIEPKERYEGDFNIKPKNPVLVLGNTYDGHTPLVSAKNISSTIEDSVVLELNIYGHSSISQPSSCTLEKVSAYWKDGTLPEPGTVCPAEGNPYADITWFDVFEKAGAGNSKPKTERARRHTLDDLSSFGEILKKRSWVERLMMK